MMAVRNGLPPLMLFLFALLVRVTAVALTQFDGLYGQDAFAYHRYAGELGQALAAGQLPPPFFWPLGYPLLVVLMGLLAGDLAVAGQIVSLLAGAAVAPLVYFVVLAYEPEAKFGAILAGLLAALAAQLLLSSLSVMSDAAAMFWAALALWLMVRYGQRLQLGWLLATAVVLVWAVLTRWVYGLLVLPWAVAAWLAWREAAYSLRRMAATAVAAGLIGLAFIGGQAYAGFARAEMAHTGDIEVVLHRWHPRHAFLSELSNSDGRFQYEYATGYFYARPAFHPAYIFPLLAPLWLLGIWAIRRQSLALRMLLLGWLLIVYLFLAGIPWQNWRFPLAFFVPLLVLVGLGFNWLWSQLSGRSQSWAEGMAGESFSWLWSQLRGRWQWLLVGYCLLALVGSGLWAWRDVGRFAAWANERRATAVAIAPYLPAEATLVAFDLTATVAHYTAVTTVELYYLTETDLAGLLAGETAVYLLLDPDHIQSQWLGHSPQQNLHWLQSHTTLQPIVEYGRFTLYQVHLGNG